jgi:hypothetical protein
MIMKARFPFLTAALLAAAASIPPAQAVQGLISATTIRTSTVTGDTSYGGCMAALGAAVNTATNSPNCPGAWVTFSCIGTYAPKEQAFHMLDQAQLALALDKKVNVLVDDTKKHNGYCFARRISVIK